ncbi:MAG: PDZ domain-containing protein [Eubacterium sp.]|nr:PDZ domain-containing protein [Eubacterium sp.]
MIKSLKRRHFLRRISSYILVVSLFLGPPGLSAGRNLSLPVSVTAKTAFAADDSLAAETAASGQMSDKQAQDDKVYVSGQPVGIYLRTKGLLVLGTQGKAAQKRLQSGDYITEVNGIPLKSKKELMTYLQENQEKELTFTILREGNRQKLRIKPTFSDETDSWQIGAWIRSDTQGIGTLTYICPDGTYTALGHGINDYDIGVPMNLSGGSIYQARISTIIKGRQESPGEILGNIDYVPDKYLGTVDINTPRGIMGKISLNQKMSESGPMAKAPGDLCPDRKLYSIAAPDQVKKGKALLRTSISGKSKDYTIEIENVSLNKKDRLKTLKIHVTDPELLSLTGGIIQGLSGSPILQDGKLVGAVTHVLVRDPARGYGILAADMRGKR